MQTFLYNLDTQKREGPIREGRYMVDGQPGILPDNLVELVITQLPNPTYDYATETIEYREYADLVNLLWVKESYVRSLTPEEIEQRKPKPPNICTPRQFRLALIREGINISNIEAMLNQIEDDMERQIALIEWEYALEIKREHPLIDSFASIMGITQEQLDNIFIVANTIE
jgi:hypothetical protein